MRQPVRMVLGLAALWLAVASVSASADEDDHDVARAALARGEVLPLAVILERVAREYPGKVLEVELERGHGRWIYELRVLQSGGTLLKLEVDAREGRVLRARGSGGSATPRAAKEDH